MFEHIFLLYIEVGQQARDCFQMDLKHSFWMQGPLPVIQLFTVVNMLIIVNKDVYKNQNNLKWEKIVQLYIIKNNFLEG